MQTPLIIAHRGDSSIALENSLEAFRLALAVPVDMIELDLRMSSDEVLYAMHDKDTGRTADRNIDMERARSQEIDSVMLRNGEHIPRLDEILKLAAGNAGLNIEIKSDGAGAVLARELVQHGSESRIMVSSFKEAEVNAVRGKIHALPAALIYDAFSTRLITDYKSKGYNIISLRKNTVTETLVKACHANGLRIMVWTIDEPEELKRCIEWGVDGIYTNKPRVLKELIGKIQKKSSK